MPSSFQENFTELLQGTVLIASQNSPSYDLSTVKHVTPAGVVDFNIERSYDGDFYEIINTTQCNNSVRFSWKDEGVFPGLIYYRIACNMNDGTTHYSNIETIRIVQR